MKKSLLIGLCFFSFQIQEIKASSENLVNALVARLIITAKLNDLSKNISNFYPRFTQLNSEIQNTYLFQIFSDEDLKTAEKINTNREIYGTCGLLSIAVLPIIGLLIGSQVGHAIGTKYDDVEKENEIFHEYAEEYKGKGMAVGASVGFISSLLLTAYLTHIPNQLPK